MRKFAISDIHGCLRSFKALLQKIGLNTSDELYLLGDFVDRGPDSKGVIDYVLDLQAQGYSIFCLRGNHDHRFIQSKNDFEIRHSWYRWGGKQTLDSFGLRHMYLIHHIPQHYWDFLNGLPYYLEVDNYLLVHAGVNFGHPQPLDDTHALMYLRYWYDQIDPDWLGDRIILHGHTPAEKSEILKRRDDLEQSPALGIDNGCFFLDRADHGRLCAFEMTQQELYFQECLDAAHV
ncbi:MAG: serine/threonine protein phosphatase [Phaeodactylibacter sp.]|nr:serine/threonine protein phosphatase [Phaeodactylibacter sp.]